MKRLLNSITSALFCSPLAETRVLSEGHHCEALETRVMLANFTVTTNADTIAADGLVSLREAINAANGAPDNADTMAGDAAGDTIDFAVGGVFFLDPANGSLNITDDLVINGTGQFIHGAGGNFSIFTINTAEQVTFNTLTIAAANFMGNGGGVNVAAGGMFTINNSNLSNNRVIGAGASGGAIYAGNGATVNVNNTTFIRNSATRAGGAIEAEPNAMLNINGSWFHGNSTGNGPGNGGAIHLTGGGGTANVMNSRFTSNIAAREGGGLWNGSGTMNITNSNITGNIANGAGADDGGGGVFNNGGTLNIMNTNITANRAIVGAGSGGGIFSTDGNVTIMNSQINSNLSRRAGGGIEVINGRVRTQMNTQLVGNRTIGLAPGAPGNGGGIHVTGTATTDLQMGTLVSRNFARNEGGGLWNQAGATMVLNGTTVTGNVSYGFGMSGGGGIFNNGGQVGIGSNSQITSNSALGDGGGLANVAGGVVNVGRSTFFRNASRTRGGGISNVGGGSTLNLFATANIVSNIAPNGGGVFNDLAGAAVLNDAGANVVGNFVGQIVQV